MCRPEKPIDWKKVDDLLIAGCLGTEIAAHFDMHPHTFYDRVFNKYNITFTNYQSEKRAQGDSILRAKQFENAIKGNVTMQIWLGKQRLDQKEHFDAPSAPNDQKLDQLLADIKSMKQDYSKPVFSLENQSENQKDISEEELENIRKKYFGHLDRLPVNATK